MRRALRFCMLTTFYPPYNFGGDGLFVKRLSHELADRGHSVDVVHCLDAFRLLQPELPTREPDPHPGVRVHRLESRVGRLSPLATHQTGLPLFKSAALRRVLDAGHDVIHFHNVSLIGGPGVLKLGSGIKLYTTHEYWLVCPTHVMFRFGRAACERPRCLACTLSYRRPPQLWRHLGLLRSACREIDAFISPSRFGIELHRRMGFEPPMTHIPNFVPRGDEGAEATSPLAPGNRPYFLFVGRLERLKGLQTILPLFRARPDLDLVVAGSGAYEQELRRIAGDSPNIRFLGHVAPTRLRPLYRNAVALIVPSLCYEVFALVLLEALREGTPVLARNVGGIPEVVATSGGGAVFDDESELSGWLDRLLASPSLRDELGRKGYEAYLREWTVDAHLERYLGLIDQLAARRAAANPA